MSLKTMLMAYLSLSPGDVRNGNPQPGHPESSTENVAQAQHLAFDFLYSVSDFKKSTTDFETLGLDYSEDSCKNKRLSDIPEPFVGSGSAMRTRNLAFDYSQQVYDFNCSATDIEVLLGPPFSEPHGNLYAPSHTMPCERAPLPKAVSDASNLDDMLAEFQSEPV